MCVCGGGGGGGGECSVENTATMFTLKNACWIRVTLSRGIARGNG